MLFRFGRKEAEGIGHGAAPVITGAITRNLKVAATSELITPNCLWISILQPAEILLNSFKAPADRAGLSGDEFFFYIVLASPPEGWVRRALSGQILLIPPRFRVVPTFLKGGLEGGLQEQR